MEIILSNDAQKQFDKLRKSDQAKVRKKLLTLSENPMLGKKLSGDLIVLFSIRSWPYRILYERNKQKIRIEIHKIAHRQGVYK